MIFATSHIKKSRKPHWCDWCGEQIDLGSSYASYPWVDCGQLNTCKMHPECYEDSEVVALAEGGEFTFHTGGFKRPAKQQEQP